MRLLLLLLVSLLLPTSCTPQDTTTNNGSSLLVRIQNQSGRHLQLYWLASHEEETTFLADLKPDQHVLDLDAFEGNSFLIQQLPPSQEQEEEQAQAQALPVLQWSVDSSPSQLVTITANWTLHVQVETTSTATQEQLAQRMLQECQQQSTTSTASQSLQDCLQAKLANSIEATRKDILHHKQLRKKHGSLWETYACDDYELETSPALHQVDWFYEEENDFYATHILHSHPNSQIHLVEEFIDPEECQAALQASEAHLYRAQVHDGKGGSQFSKHRKAWQAAIPVNWDDEEEGDLIARLSRRVYDYTNHVLGLNIQEQGQEHLMMIQYYGAGMDSDEPPDQYQPHCDGACNGKPHKRGTRMATMVMYCEVPDVGGHTNFRNAGVHIQPQVGSAVFFSYINPHTLMTDDGFTSHSGCPVYEGTKKIITQWIRLGVDQDNPYSSFNTLGVQKEEEEDSEDEEEEQTKFYEDEEEEWDEWHDEEWEEEGEWDEEEYTSREDEEHAEKEDWQEDWQDGVDEDQEP